MGRIRPTYMRGGWRKGTCFQEWGLVTTAGKRGGQPGGGGATGAAPALSIVFRDPHIQIAHTAQVPAELYLLPQSRGLAAKFHQLSTFAEKGVVLLVRHSFHRGVRVPAPPLPGSSHTQLLLSLWGSSWAQPSQQTTATVPSVSALTLFHGKNSGAGGPGGMSVRGEPTHPAFKSHLGSGGDAMPSGRASPLTELGSN